MSTTSHRPSDVLLSIPGFSVAAPPLTGVPHVVPASTAGPPGDSPRSLSGAPTTTTTSSALLGGLMKAPLPAADAREALASLDVQTFSLAAPNLQNALSNMLRALAAVVQDQNTLKGQIDTLRDGFRDTRSAVHAELDVFGRKLATESVPRAAWTEARDADQHRLEQLSQGLAQQEDDRVATLSSLGPRVAKLEVELKAAKTALQATQAELTGEQRQRRQYESQLADRLVALDEVKAQAAGLSSRLDAGEEAVQSRFQAMLDAAQHVDPRIAALDNRVEKAETAIRDHHARLDALSLAAHSGRVAPPAVENATAPAVVPKAAATAAARADATQKEDPKAGGDDQSTAPPPTAITRHPVDPSTSTAMRAATSLALPPPPAPASFSGTPSAYPYGHDRPEATRGSPDSHPPSLVRGYNALPHHHHRDDGLPPRVLSDVFRSSAYSPIIVRGGDAHSSYDPVPSSSGKRLSPPRPPPPTSSSSRYSIPTSSPPPGGHHPAVVSPSRCGAVSWPDRHPMSAPMSYHDTSKDKISPPRVAGGDGAASGRRRRRLGVEVNNAIDGAAGVTVTSVAAQSPAEMAGLSTGDVVTHVNGAPVRDKHAFRVSVLGLHEGQPMVLTLLPGGRFTAASPVELFVPC